MGARFQLGKTNTVNAITNLVGSVAGSSLRIDNNSTDASATALDLQVEPGKAPMTVNSEAQVANLNSDKLDGKSANEIGVNGLQQVFSTSPTNSESPKGASATCPGGKVLVGTGYDIQRGKSGVFPNAETDVVVDQISPSNTTRLDVIEDEPISADWEVQAWAFCAKAP